MSRIEEKYIVRVIKSNHAKDSGNIGWVNPDTDRSNYWTTTYTQLEHADKDAELIAEAVGTDVDPKLIDQAMTPEYSERYAELFDKASAKKVDLGSSQQLQKFVKSQGLSPKETELLKTRHKINKNYGANEQFLGIGITKDVNSPDSLGIVETYSLDKKPGQLGDLEQAGILKRVGLTSY